MPLCRQKRDDVESGDDIKDILSHSFGKMRVDEESGKTRRRDVSHSVSIHREWAIIKAISFPLELE